MQKCRQLSGKQVLQHAFESAKTELFLREEREPEFATALLLPGVLFFSSTASDGEAVIVSEIVCHSPLAFSRSQLVQLGLI